jgi:hypothetical protein
MLPESGNSPRTAAALSMPWLPMVFSGGFTVRLCRKVKSFSLKILSLHLVLYYASGTNISACSIDTISLILPFIVDTTLYRVAVKEMQETHFLSAILNTECVNKAIKSFQATGLLGERHVHKKVLDLPVPLYDAKNPTHRKLSELGEQADELARTAVQHHAFPAGSSLARQRAYVRTAVKDQLDEIDDLVKPLLGLS